MSDTELVGRGRAHVASVRFLRFSVKVVRHNNGIYFGEAYGKRNEWSGFRRFLAPLCRVRGAHPSETATDGVACSLSEPDRRLDGA